MIKKLYYYLRNIWPFSVFIPIFSVLIIFVVKYFYWFDIPLLKQCKIRSDIHSYSECLFTTASYLLITFIILTISRIYICRWLLSKHFWINDISPPRKIWWYMFAVKILTTKLSFSTKKFKMDDIIYDVNKQVEDLLVKAKIKDVSVNKLNSNVSIIHDNKYTMNINGKTLSELLKSVNHKVDYDMTFSKSLYSLQVLLPHLSLPSLNQTISKLLDSLDPIANYNYPSLPDHYEERLIEFKNGIGRILQLILWFRSNVWTDNYVSDWWEKYVYLMNRNALPINSNYYILDMSYFIPTHKPSARAATIIYQLLKFRQLILTETLEPLKIKDTIPVCMAQYRRLFSTCRIPGIESDNLKHYEPDESNHITISFNGKYYLLPVTNKAHNFEPLPAWILQIALEQILQLSSTSPNNLDSQQSENHDILESYLSSFTYYPRNKWAEIRNKHFVDHDNSVSLKLIESSIFMVTFHDGCYSNSADEKISNGIMTLTEQAYNMITGFDVNSSTLNQQQNKSKSSECKNGLWFDKSLNIFIFPNAKFGLNCEHSYGDATIAAHMHEYVLSHEVKEISYDSNGDCLGYSDYVDKLSRTNLDSTMNGKSKSFCSSSISNSPNLHNVDNDDIGLRLTPITRFQWDLTNPDLRREIIIAKNYALKQSRKIDICVKDFSNFGKGFMKKHKMSPDAFVQIAIQMAYFESRLKALSIDTDDCYKILKDEDFVRQSGLFTSTYEASSVRLFLQGRTETVRSVSREMVDFVSNFYDKRVDTNHKIDLLKKAAHKHQVNYREALTGKGFDRHLFALYVTSRMIGKESKILKEILGMPWELSTSQSPQQQQTTTEINFDSPLLADKLSPGGGFGPVTPNGFGIAYMFPCNYKMFFHVTRFIEEPPTSSNIDDIDLESQDESITLNQHLNQPRMVIGTASEFMETLFKSLMALQELLGMA